VADTFLLADRYSATLLRNAALLCAAQNADAMVDTDGWAHLVATQPRLMADVVYALAKGVPPPLHAAGTTAEVMPPPPPGGGAGEAAQQQAQQAHDGGGAEHGRATRSTRQRLQ
jgi:hypothetical protein